MKRDKLEATVMVVGATGEARHRHGVLSAERGAVGVYTIRFPPDRAVRVDGFHLGLTVLNSDQLRVATFASPGGDSIQVRTFDALGDPADADFQFSAQRL